MAFERLKLRLYIGIYGAVLFSALTPSNTLHAQDAEIDNAVETNTTTSGLLGNAGTLTITADGSIEVATGTALTLNGNHSLILDGSLTSNDPLAGIGLRVLTADQAIGADLTLNGTISVEGPELNDLDVDTLTNNIGIDFTGINRFSGTVFLDPASSVIVQGGNARGILFNAPTTIDFTNDGTISVTGINSIAVDINAPFMGAFRNDGAINALNANSTGIRVGAAIDGTLIQAGTISVGEGSTFDEDGVAVDAIPGVAGIHVTNDIAGGLLLEGIGIADLDADVAEAADRLSVFNSQITSTGGAPGLLIQNEKTDGSDLVIGSFDDTGFAIVQRGNIFSLVSDTDISATGVRISGNGSAGTILEGGFHLDNGTIDVDTVDADARGIIIDTNATVPSLLLEGTVNVAASVSIDADGNLGPAGTATGVFISEGSTVNSIVNNGLVSVTSAGEVSDAFGILDLSGSLVSFDNSGSLFAITPEESTGQAVAFDNRASSNNLLFINTGNIVGDIFLGNGNTSFIMDTGTLQGDLSFGAGDDSLDISESIIIGDIDLGAGAGQINISNQSSLTGSLLGSGNLDLTVSDSELLLGTSDRINVANASFLSGSNVILTIDPVTNSSASINASGAVNFDEAASVQLEFDSFLFEEQSYELITANTLNFEQGIVPTDLLDIPVIFDVVILDPGTNGTLAISLAPRSAEDLGLSSNSSALYENLLQAINPEELLGPRLSRLDTVEEVEDSLKEFTPDLSGGSLLSGIIATKQYEAIFEDRIVDLSGKNALNGGFWAQEVVSYSTLGVSGDANADKDSFGIGLAVGYDTNITSNFLLGFGAGFLLQSFDQNGAIGDDLSIFMPYISTYGLYQSGGFFASGTTSLWFQDIERERNTTLVPTIENSSSSIMSYSNLQTGYNFDFGSFHFRPAVGVSYLFQRENSFDEITEVGADLRIFAENYDRLDGFVNLSLGYDFGKTKGGLVFRPEIFGSYKRQLSGAEQVVREAQFINGGDPFSLVGDILPGDATEIGAHLNVFGDNSTARLRYSYETQDELTTHYLGFNFLIKF